MQSSGHLVGLHCVPTVRKAHAHTHTGTETHTDRYGDTHKAFFHPSHIVSQSSSARTKLLIVCPFLLVCVCVCVRACLCIQYVCDEYSI